MKTHLAKKFNQRKKVDRETSWGGVASWYDDHLTKHKDTYHLKVIFPNLLRLLGNLSGKRVLDMACGQGQFSQILRKEGAFVTGVDVGEELIDIAKKHNVSIRETNTHKVDYFVSSVDDLYMCKDNSFDRIVCILALQNIENLSGVCKEASRVLKKGGTFTFVINHPAFRNPRHTHWGWHEDEKIQYRRVDTYMSESKIKVDMTPGSSKNKKFTVSFHRPLQVYVKALIKQGLLVNGLEEWISHKQSEPGPRKKSEDTARKEIPLFMCIVSTKI
jgi:ubiquinone/menaquinone biosynthesis C-methylase UbiE